MHSRETVAEVLGLADKGLNSCEISRRTGVSRPTVREWRIGKLPHSFKSKPLLYGRPTEPGACCSRCGASKHRFDHLSTAYVYLLGLYLGDGCISRGARDVFRLRIALDVKYGGIVEECASAMQAVVPWNKVHCQVTPKNYVEVHAYSKSWPCLFPQHGPDGCRFINTGSFGWECPRYAFTNLSDDIKGIFCDACDQLGLHWTTAPPSLSTSRARRMWRGSMSSSGRRDEAGQLS